MNEQTIRFRLGIFVLAALIVLAVLVTLFGGFPGYFKKFDMYTIEFDNADGVSAGTPVKRSGVRIGEVRAVRLDNATGTVAVEIAIEDGYYLQPGSRPTLERNVLGSDTSIVFQPPVQENKAPDRIPPGTKLKGQTPPDPTALLQKAAELVVPTQEAMVEIRKVFKSIDKILPNLDEAVKSFREVAGTGKEIMPELKKTNAEIQDLARVTRKAMPGFEKTSDEIRALAKSTRDVIPELRQTNEEVASAVRTVGRLGERADVLLQTNEKKLTESVEQMQEALRRTNQALNDENLRNLNETMRNVRIGSERLDSIAKGTDETLRDTRVALKQLTESLQRADLLLSDLQKLSGPLGKSSPIILKNLEETTTKLNSAATDFNELLRVVSRGDGTIQRLLSDPSLYNNLNDAAAMVTRVIPRVDRILADVAIFADRLARHPELLGIRGAVAPSSGVKGAPSQLGAPGH